MNTDRNVTKQSIKYVCNRKNQSDGKKYVNVKIMKVYNFLQDH